VTTENGGPVQWLNYKYGEPAPESHQEKLEGEKRFIHCHTLAIQAFPSLVCMTVSPCFSESLAATANSADPECCTDGEYFSSKPGCERWQFVVGADEAMLSSDMGLYRNFTASQEAAMALTISTLRLLMREGGQQVPGPEGPFN
jgi:hypothetical protein